VGITDKVTGRVKQAAGDLLGDESLHRRGKNEERKAEAREELAREQERVERKAAEVEELERLTSPAALTSKRSREELDAEARELGIEGRSEMTKGELAAEIQRKRASR
jgi:uncharacterized protein YjbJ (UPF0337 family)